MTEFDSRFAFPSAHRFAHKGLRLLLGLLLVCVLVLFIHFREERVELLELNAIATRYIVGQVPFEFPDEEATMLQRSEAIRDVSPVFKIDEREIRRVKAEFQQILLRGEEWRRHTTSEEIDKGLEDLEFALGQIRLTDSKTLNKVRLFPFQDPLFAMTLTEKQLVRLPRAFWEDVEKYAFVHADLAEWAVQCLISFFSSQRWDLQEDISFARQIKQAIQESIPDKYTRVEAGSQLIVPGERVTMRHIAMLQAMKSAMQETRQLWSPMTIAGSLLLGFVMLGITSADMRSFHKDLYASTKKVALLVTLIVLTLLLAKAEELLFLYNGKNLIEQLSFPLVIPFATILISVLLGRGVALFTSFVLLILLGVSLAMSSERFLVINLVASLASLRFSRGISMRKEIFAVGAKVWACCAVVVIAYHLIDNTLLQWKVGVDLLATFVMMGAISMFIVAILPLLESLFQVMTDMTLMEYMDPNHELLRRLSLEAPGTYQHSLMVGNLSEAAASAIGAHGLFVRVSALYHDVGKLCNPHYFTENQLGGFNIHQLLTPLESAQVIVGHVAEGEALARKHRLPKNFIDIIREHHGTSMVYYFYCKQVEQMGGDLTKVNEELFHYNGPKPHSKESAIIMIADMLEAASRSLEEVSETGLSELLEKLIKERAQENQLDACQLTFEELGLVKKAMVRCLMVTRHLRVKYPAKA